MFLMLKGSFIQAVKAANSLIRHNGFSRCTGKNMSNEKKGTVSGCSVQCKKGYKYVNTTNRKEIVVCLLELPGGR